jgi:hypothetical protein
MNVRKTLVALPAAATLLLAGVSAAGAQSLPPTIAAQLNAGTAQTGIGLNGYVGVGISAVVPESMDMADVEVAGIQLAFDGNAGSQTVSTLGTPQQAALLNAGTAWSGIGRFGVVGVGIAGPLPTIENQAALADDTAAFAEDAAE